MKQIIQDLKKGDTILEEVPVPRVKAGTVLIKTTRSLVSLGTERMLVDFGKANFLQKAKQQPDKVKMVLEKVKTDGLRPTLEAVFNKLGQPLPLGYCNVGKVVAVGNGVQEFSVGDRVASNGNHAEFVSVPKNLVAKIPDNVSDEEATFTVIGSIGLQGIRLLNPTFGETFVVVGLGLIGLVTAELLLANGCNVIGFDFDNEKIRIAKEKGITAVNPSEGTDQVKFVESITDGVGADGVIITASSKSNEIISQSAKMCRKRGRVVLVGVIGLDISRADFFEKEITFQVSCSYGPGRYDESYEKKGQDYPIGFVRWTEKRNFEAVLNAISRETLNVKPLITDRIPLSEYQRIYGDMGNSKSIAAILEYSSDTEIVSSIEVNKKSFEGKKGVIGIIGSGNFTSSTMMPNLKKVGADLKYIASSGGLSSTIMAKKYGIAKSTTNYQEILEDENVDLVIITTQHNTHSRMVVETARAGKSVFVEKPLALSKKELSEVIESYEKNNVNISVGFNRRFAPLTTKIKKALGNGETPVNIIATMNAGYIPKDFWVHDMQVGGGRIIGEACHFIDLCSYIAESKVISVCMNAMGKNPAEDTDSASILLKYLNGSTAVINYFSNGSKSYSKERVEVYSQERTIVMDNWRKLKFYGFKGASNSSVKQDKGHFNQFQKLIDQHKKGGEPIIPFGSIVNTTKASFAAINSLKEGKWISVE
ncbi:bi-domain-containing oxidoreductase [Flavobacteriaceae bacterium]|nr:bi-domain-containing oxidoreductase [Flavobacteriaceae bacterium]